MAPKTSFKQLLTKSGSNPTVNLQNVRAQREKLQQLKQPAGAPSAKAERPASGATSSSRPTASVAPPAAASSSSSSFVPAATFAGARPGFAFKAGPQGVGYYREGEEESEAVTTFTGGDEPMGEGEDGGESSALPRGFFDNPQNDPANKGKEVARTQKQQTLNEELDDFNKEVEADLIAAEAADEAADDDEEEFKLREAVAVARALDARIAGLKRQREAIASARGRGDEGAAAASAEAGPSKGGDGGEDEEEDDDEEVDLGSLLDWRTKGI